MTVPRRHTAPSRTLLRNAGGGRDHPRYRLALATLLGAALATLLGAALATLLGAALATLLGAALATLLGAALATRFALSGIPGLETVWPASTACAAANLAIGTRNGEQLT